jgi:hypothetical protein
MGLYIQLLRRDNNARFFPRGKVRQVSLLEQGGGVLQAGDSDHRDHRDRLPPTSTTWTIRRRRQRRNFRRNFSWLISVPVRRSDL